MAIISDYYDTTYNHYSMFKNIDSVQNYLATYHNLKGKKLGLWKLFKHNMKVNSFNLDYTSYYSYILFVPFII